MNLTINVISDVICPWCFTGKRRLEKAVTAQQHEVRVRWLPFQLNPTSAAPRAIAQADRCIARAERMPRGCSVGDVRGRFYSDPRRARYSAWVSM